MKYPIKSLLFALPLALATALHANLIVNGSFETGNNVGWTIVPADIGSYCVVCPTLTSFGYAAQDGNYAVGFGAIDSSLDTIYQAFSTVAGQSYNLNFWVHNTAGWSGSTLLASWDSAYLSGYGSNALPITNDMGSFDWTEYSFTNLATSAQTTIAFSGLSNADWIFIDNISVTQLLQPTQPTQPTQPVQPIQPDIVRLTTSVAVPDAGSTGLLLGLGLITIAGLRRGRGLVRNRPARA